MIFLFSLLIAVKNAGADDPCFAGPNIYGPQCISSEGVFDSQNNATIIFNFDPSEDGTELLCEATVASPDVVPDAMCTVNQWYPVIDGVEALWGAGAGNPAVRCKGVPFHTTFSWSYSIGESSYGNCLSPQPTYYTPNKFSQTTKAPESSNGKTVIIILGSSLLIISLVVVITVMTYFIQKKARQQNLQTPDYGQYISLE